jgi:hypothetical protein
MLRDILKNLFRLTPISFQELIRNKMYHNWEKNGKSIPPPQVVKLFKIRELQKKYDCKLFIETGTYKGDMIYALKNDFEQLITVELSEQYHQKAVEKFRNDKHINLLLGDSGILMPKIIKDIKVKTLFWLDGHFSSGNTAQGELDCPIFGELDAIFSSPFKHVLLIDDARYFNGTNDYPTIEGLKSYIEKSKPGSYISNENDLITVILT